MVLNRWQDHGDALGSARVSTMATTREQRDAARLFTAVHADGVEDCALLLDILGLGPVGGEWT